MFDSKSKLRPNNWGAAVNPEYRKILLQQVVCLCLTHCFHFSTGSILSFQFKLLLLISLFLSEWKIVFEIWSKSFYVSKFIVISPSDMYRPLFRFDFWNDSFFKVGCSWLMINYAIISRWVFNRGFFDERVSHICISFFLLSHLSSVWFYFIW